jgi:hypothetical protein
MSEGNDKRIGTILGGALAVGGSVVVGKRLKTRIVTKRREEDLLDGFDEQELSYFNENCFMIRSCIIFASDRPKM